MQKVENDIHEEYAVDLQPSFPLQKLRRGVTGGNMPQPPNDCLMQCSSSALETAAFIYAGDQDWAMQ